VKKIAIVLIALGISGCLMTRTEAENVQQKKVIQDNLLNLQKSTADQQSKFNDINNDLRELNGRVEVLENKISVLQQDKEKMRKERDEALAESNKKISALQEEIVKVEAQVAAFNSSSSEKPSKNYLQDAEDSYSKKEWKKAIFSYQKFREAFPKNKKVPEATLRIGISFIELGMKDEARTFLEEVVSKYPESPSAKVAKARLKKLK
jgi:TolA-binding protein